MRHGSRLQAAKLAKKQKDKPRCVFRQRAEWEQMYGETVLKIVEPEGNPFEFSCI